MLLSAARCRWSLCGGAGGQAGGWMWTAETPEGGRQAMCVLVSVSEARRAAGELENFTAFTEGHL